VSKPSRIRNSSPLQEEILSQRKQLASRDAEIELLKLLIAKLRRMQFGRSSEKRSPDRTTGTAAGRTGSKANERNSCGEGISPGEHCSSATCAARVT